MDVSFIFLLFFSLFFAILIGDAVYGFLLLGLTGLIRRKWKAAPAELVPLLRILSIATIVWGVLTGSWLGLQNLPAPLRAAQIGWLKEPDGKNLTFLCFLIGAIQLTLAHAWSGWRQRRSAAALSQAGWIGIVWFMFLLACFFVLDRPLPAFWPWLLGVSLAAVALFLVPPSRLKQDWPSFCVLPFTIIGNFGDIVSYMRLYLIGSASTTLIITFNDMMLGRGVPTFWSGLVAAAVLFAVHGLNILLNSLSVLVHGVRLNALEFSSHLGIQWTGIRYAPFAAAARSESGGLPEAREPDAGQHAE